MALPAWVPDEEHKPAPEPLLLVQSLVNTRNLDLDTDLLAEPGPGNAWLHQAGLLAPGAMAAPDDLRAARDVREGLRALIAQGSGGPTPADDDLQPLRAVAHTAQPRLTISPNGQVELGSGEHGRLAEGLLSLLLVIRDAQLDGTWTRLKVCSNPDCLWVFYDRSHSRRGAWCDMASCGNLIKNRNFRARRGSQTQPRS